MRSCSAKKALCSAAALAVCIGLATPSFALTVSLAELAGGLEMDPGAEPDFGYPGWRECDFVIPDNVVAIEDLTFVLSGSWHEGEVSCATGFPEPEISPILPPVTILITSEAFPGDYFVSSIGMPDDSFDNLTAGFTSSYPPGVLEFDDLLGAALHAELLIDWAVLGICSVTIDSYGILDRVELQISGTVSTRSAAFGQVKSLYR